MVKNNECFLSPITFPSSGCSSQSNIYIYASSRRFYPKELGAKTEPLGQRTEVESRPQRLEAETGDPHAKAETGRTEEDQSARMALNECELRDSQEPVETGPRNWLVLRQEAGEGGWVGT